jgi:aspartate-semialdehyde dehydrogenase
MSCFIITEPFTNKIKIKINIIANPKCSTIRMMAALKSLQLKTIDIGVDTPTFQAVSGGGKNVIDELHGASVFTQEDKEITS